MRINSKIVGIVCTLAVIFGVVRLVAWSGKQEAEQDSSRLFVCEACKSVSALDPDVIRLSYEQGAVRVTPEGGARFKCPSCGEVAARGENLDFGDGVVRCRECDAVILETKADAYKAVRNGDVKVDDQGQLAFRCSRCDKFSGRMTSPVNPDDEETAALEN